jgi:hypothetical protein
MTDAASPIHKHAVDGEVLAVTPEESEVPQR